MKTLTTFILAGALALLAQPNQLDLRQDPPTAVQSERVSSAYTGASGATTYYYWVVTRYPIGFIVPTAPVVVGGAAALGGGNSVALAWPAMTGASSYDVLRTTTNAAPSSCTCAVVLATTGTTLTDNGGALSAWPPGGLNSAGAAQAELQINNRDAGAPYITLAVRNAQRILNYQLGVLKNGAAPSYVPGGFIQPYSNAQGALACVDSTGADCMATRPGPTNYCADVGGVNAYACAFTPAIVAYAVGNTYRFSAATANTGPPTVNFNGLGAVAIKTPAGSDPVSNDIRPGQTVTVVYTAGSVMQMQSTVGNTAEVINVRDFGAVGDGTTDDVAAIRAALSAAAVTYPASRRVSLFNTGACYMVTGQIVVPGGVQLVGDSRNACIKAKTGFPTDGTSVLYLGTETDGQQGTRAENLTVDCGGIATVGAENALAQEQGGYVHLLVKGCSSRGVYVHGPSAQNSFLEDIEVQSGTAGVTTTIGIDIDEVTAFRGITGATVNGFGYTTKPDVGIRITKQGFFRDLHVEHTTDGVLLANGGGGNTTDAATVRNLQVGPNTDNAVHIAAGNQNYAALDVLCNGCTNTIVDDVLSYTSTRNPYGYYIVGNGSGGLNTRLSSDNATPWQMNSTFKLTNENVIQFPRPGVAASIHGIWGSAGTLMLGRAAAASNATQTCISHDSTTLDYCVDTSGNSKPLRPVAPSCTIASLPASPVVGLQCYFTDASTTSDCTVGGGSAKSLCVYDGAAWAKP